MKTYRINEIFKSKQGEGARQSTENVFIRFSGCNLRCNRTDDGFDCDTEFTSGRDLTAQQIFDEVIEVADDCKAIIFTGGEPSLQLDETLIQLFKEIGFYLAIETNGTRKISHQIDWITVSPKTAEHTLQQTTANEVKYVRSAGMGIPKTSVKADHYFVSPAFDADQLSAENLNWCKQLVIDNPGWALSIQMHKIWKVR